MVHISWKESLAVKMYNTFTSNTELPVRRLRAENSSSIEPAHAVHVSFSEPVTPYRRFTCHTSITQSTLTNTSVIMATHCYSSCTSTDSPAATSTYLISGLIGNSCSSISQSVGRSVGLVYIHFGPQSVRCSIISVLRTEVTRPLQSFAQSLQSWDVIVSLPSDTVLSQCSSTHVVEYTGVNLSSFTFSSTWSSLCCLTATTPRNV